MTLAMLRFAVALSAFAGGDAFGGPRGADGTSSPDVEQRTIQLDDVVRLRFIDAVRISADGRRIAVFVFAIIMLALCFTSAPVELVFAK